MTFDETLTCQCGQDLPRAECECHVPACEPRGKRCARQYANVESKQEVERQGAACGFYCRSCALGCIDQRGNWLASYVRTRLRTMAGDVFPISRHTADVAARALQDRFFSDTDVVLKRILDLAALRYLRDGSSTVTLEDVAAALRSLSVPHR
jgi:hypothetical protein